jgi:hypothetical protein
VPSNTAAKLHTQLAGGKIQFIMKGNHIRGRDLQESGGLLHGITTRVHVGLWL